MSSPDDSSQDPHDTTLTVDESVALTIGADSLLILGMDYSRPGAWTYSHPCR